MANCKVVAYKGCRGRWDASINQIGVVSHHLQSLLSAHSVNRFVCIRTREWDVLILKLEGVWLTCLFPKKCNYLRTGTLKSWNNLHSSWFPHLHLWKILHRFLGQSFWRNQLNYSTPFFLYIYPWQWLLRVNLYQEGVPGIYQVEIPLILADECGVLLSSFDIPTPKRNMVMINW